MLCLHVDLQPAVLWLSRVWGQGEKKCHLPSGPILLFNTWGAAAVSWEPRKQQKCNKETMGVCMSGKRECVTPANTELSSLNPFCLSRQYSLFIRLVLRSCLCEGTDRCRHSRIVTLTEFPMLSSSGHHLQPRRAEVAAPGRWR